MSAERITAAHKFAARAAGRLSLALARGKLSRSQLKEALAEINAAALILEKVISSEANSDSSGRR